MGSQIDLWLDATYEEAEAAFADVEKLFARVEEALSRFKPESELSQLNARPGKWVRVSPLLWEVLNLALEMSRATDGLFDPTLLNALEAAGYRCSFEELTNAANEPDAAPQQTGTGHWQAIRLAKHKRAVSLPPGVRIDLGGIAKGYTAQQAVELMRRSGPCLVDAGGDLTAGDAPYGLAGWPVAVAAPWSHEGEIPVDVVSLWLTNASLATSGVDYRHWTYQGHSAHHIIDPCSGQPSASDVLTASVLAPTASSAEAWATASLVAGTHAALQALAARDMAAVLIDRERRVKLTPSMQRQASSQYSII